MRIDELRLLAFGPFSGQRLDFASGNHGVHVVYGPNEAGKSSALRALRDGLFGIPHTSRDNFRHDYPAMRIGFTIRGSDDIAFAATRKKGNRNTLLNPETDEPLPDARLVQLLSGIARESYEAMFGLDHAMLIEGGRELALMQGSVGETLFSAAGGISSLRKLEEDLDAESDRLFRPRGQRLLNNALARYGELKKQLRQQQLLSRDYAQNHAELKAQQAGVENLTARLADLRTKRGRYVRLQDSLSLLEQRRQNGLALVAHADTRLLRLDFDDDVREANESYIKAEGQYIAATKTLEDIEASLNELPAPDVDAKHRHLEKTLADKLGAHRKALNDLPGLQRRAAAKKQEVEARLQRLRPDLTLNDYAVLFVNAVERARVQQLGTNVTAARNQITAAIADLAKAKEAVECAEKDLGTIPVPLDTRTLQEAIEHARSRGDSETRLATLKTSVTRKRAAIEADVTRAGRWIGDPAALASLALPTPATMTVHETALTETARRLQQAKDALTSLEKEHRRACEELDATIAVDGDLPTEADVASARKRRDHLWTAIRDSWERHTGVTNAEAASGSDSADMPGIGSEYEKRVQAADDTVDRVRSEHARVALRARLESEKESRRRGIEVATDDVRVAEADRNRCEGEWQAVWQPLNVKAGTPAEMREWLAAVREICTALAALNTLEDEVTDLTQFAKDAHSRLAGQIKGLHGPDTVIASSLAELISSCQRFVSDQASLREQLAAKNAALENGRTQVTQLTNTVNTLEEESRKRQGEWETSMSKLGLPTTATPAEANAQINEWSDAYSLAHGLLGPDGEHQRIEHVEADLREFIELVARAAETVCHPVQPLDASKAADVAEELIARIQKARLAENRITDAGAQKKAAAAKVRDKQSDLNAAKAKLIALAEEAGEEAGVDSSETLRELYKASQERRRLEARRDEIELSLQALAAQQPLDAWASEAAQHSVDDLVRRLSELDQEIKDAENERQKKTTAMGELASNLNSIGSGTVAVTIAAQIQAELATIETLAREYALLWVSSVVLRKAIENFGEQNKGELLRLAGDFFATLTNGAFSGLVVDYDEDRPVIAGRKANVPAPIRVEAMSEGTSDQLYLALRLAYLSTWTDRHEPLPLILDDVLMAFDDDRAAAALKAFATLSAKTQIILFTHHRHIVQIARETLPEDVLSIQDLTL